MQNIILKELEKIEKENQVKILMAVESGSRAWGIASQDSDYDVRFLYVRPEEAYLRLCPERDVIEWKLDDTLDISGWDLKKHCAYFIAPIRQSLSGVHLLSYTGRLRSFRNCRS